jgi:hypothetical protein
MPLLTLCHVVRTSGLLGPERVPKALKIVLTVSEQYFGQFSLKNRSPHES